MLRPTPAQLDALGDKLLTLGYHFLLGSGELYYPVPFGTKKTAPDVEAIESGAENRDYRNLNVPQREGGCQ